MRWASNRATPIMFFYAHRKCFVLRHELQYRRAQPNTTQHIIKHFGLELYARETQIQKNKKTIRTSDYFVGMGIICGNTVWNNEGLIVFWICYYRSSNPRTRWNGWRHTDNSDESNSRSSNRNRCSIQSIFSIKYSNCTASTTSNKFLNKIF